MANKVTVEVTGADEAKVLNDVDTVQDVLDEVTPAGVNFTALVNGKPASKEDKLTDYSFVILTREVKGGNL